MHVYTLQEYRCHLLQGSESDLQSPEEDIEGQI